MNIDDYLMARDLITNVYNVQQMNKVAKPLGDYGGAIATSVIPYIGGPANVVGSIAGSLNEAPTEKEEKDMDDNPTLSLVPGVGAYRVGRRLRAQTESDRGDFRHTLGTLFGDTTSTLATTTAATILGAALGAYGGKRYGNTGDKYQDIGVGAGIGAMGGMALGAGGSLLAQIVAAIKAGVTPTRTKAEQRAYANDPSIAAEFLVPGVATYNRFKSYGRSMADAKERDKKDEKKDKAAEKTASLNDKAHDLINKFFA